MMRNITVGNDNWSETLPVVILPFHGESLIGYLLRLDYVNGFTQGTVIKELIPENMNLNLGKRDIHLILEEVIDTDKLSTLVNLPKELLDSLMLTSIRKKLYGGKVNLSNFFLEYGGVKICPLCLQERKIPMLHLIDEIDTCLIHGVKLQSKCSCGRSIKVINQYNPFVCRNNDCNKEYTTLIENQTPEKIKEQALIQTHYNNYFFENIPLVKETEDISLGIFKRIKYLDNVKQEAITCLYKDIPLTKTIEPLPVCNHTDEIQIQKISTIIANIYDFRISPLQFLNLEVDEQTMKSEVIELQLVIGYQSVKINRENFSNMFINTMDFISKSILDKEYTNFVKEIKTDTGVTTRFLDMIKLKGKVRVNHGSLSTTFSFFITPIANQKETIEYNLTFNFYEKWE